MSSEETLLNGCGIMAAEVMAGGDGPLSLKQTRGMEGGGMEEEEEDGEADAEEAAEEEEVELGDGGGRENDGG